MPQLYRDALIGLCTVEVHHINSFSHYLAVQTVHWKYASYNTVKTRGYLKSTEVAWRDLQVYIQITGGDSMKMRLIWIVTPERRNTWSYHDSCSHITNTTLWLDIWHTHDAESWSHHHNYSVNIHLIVTIKGLSPVVALSTLQQLPTMEHLVRLGLMPW